MINSYVGKLCLAFLIFLHFQILSLTNPYSIATKAFAFNEEFDSSPLDSSIWQIYENEGTVTIDSGVIRLSADYTHTFPYIHTKENPIPIIGDFSVKFRIKYNLVNGWGDGVVLATKIPSNGTADTPISDPLFSQQYFLEVWQDTNLGFIFAYSGDCYNTSCSLDDILVFQKNEIDTNYHIIEFKYSDARYSILLDNVNIFTSNPTTVRPTALWFGNHTTQGSGYTWSEFELDYIRISSPPPSPSPSPSPTPTPLPPLVFLPGMGASWNYETIVHGNPQPQSEWGPLPGFDFYDGFLQTLRNAGYESEGPGKNLYNFWYDWTKPVASIAADLNQYISETVNPPPGQEINLIGHSLGGLVARTYVQNNRENPVEKVVSVGSPHSGVPQVYFAWEGGQIHQLLDGWQRVAASLLLYLRSPPYPTMMETIRNSVPSLGNLLPTFNYLKQDLVEKPVNTMDQQNLWLANLDLSPPSHLLNLLTTIAGNIPDSTLRWIHVINRSWLDDILGLWTDGRPNGTEENEAGDQAVLTNSAHLNGADLVILDDHNHGEIIASASGQQKILEILGLTASEIAVNPEQDYSSSLIFQLASGAVFSQITDPFGNPISFPDNKTIIIPNPAAGQYQIEISGSETGQYRLIIGQLFDNEDFWTALSAIIINGEKQNWQVNFDPENPSPDPLIDPGGTRHAASALIEIDELINYLQGLSIRPGFRQELILLLRSARRLVGRQLYHQAILRLHLFRLYLAEGQEADFIGEEPGRIIRKRSWSIIQALGFAYLANQFSSYPPEKLQREINQAQKLLKFFEFLLKRANGEGSATPDLGALYLLAKETLGKAKETASYESHLYALNSGLFSTEGLILLSQ